MPTKKERERKLHQLEKVLNYEFNNFELLIDAMNRCKYQKTNEITNKEYVNDVYATIGDAVLKLIISKMLFNDGIKNKYRITEYKKNFESNNTLFNIDQHMGLYLYGYNELHFADEEGIPQHEKISHGKHDVYVEAIVGAIFLDSDFETTYNWYKEKIFPLTKY